jgi:hypothetical protein
VLLARSGSKRTSAARSRLVAIVRAWDHPSCLPDSIAELPLMDDALRVIAVHKFIAEHGQISGSLLHRLVAI